MFSWNLGTCVPKGVIQKLSNTQPQLQSLSITNDTSCKHDFSLSWDGFDELSSLRRVCFVPIGHPNERTVGKILRQNAHGLEEITFNRQHCWSDGHTWEDMTKQNAFAHNLLNLQPGAGYLLFRSLRKLALSFVSFKHGIEDMMTALNFPQLFSLRLRDCLGMNQAFMALTQSSPLQLTCLEVNFTGAYVEQDDIMPLIMFLRSFSGLQDLFVLCRPLQEQAQDFWLSVDHHRSTLHRFIYQQSTLYGSRSDPELDTLWGLNIVGYIGICCEIQKLVNVTYSLMNLINGADDYLLKTN
jgi:hypothetical protein